MVAPLQETAAADDSRKAFDTILMAFVADPVCRWMYPTSERYFRHFPGFIKGLAGPSVERKAAWRLGDYDAVALWLPPGAESDGEAIGAHVEATVEKERLDDLFSIVEQMDAHHPAYPHWYLPWLGVDVAKQGKGLGGELMKRTLARVDEEHLPAYLESPNPRNVAFYERHGFEVVGVSETKKAPPLTFMLREAR